MTNTSERANDLRKVQKYFFAAYDLQLFLDTHPTNKEALRLYASTVEKAKRAKAEFEEKYGPLSPFSAASNTEYWQWIENPWPWDAQDD